MLERTLYYQEISWNPQQVILPEATYRLINQEEVSWEPPKEVLSLGRLPGTQLQVTGPIISDSSSTTTLHQKEKVQEEDCVSL